LSDHATGVSDRVDLGHRIFLAGFFTAFGTGAGLLILGYGLTNSPLIVLAAIVNALLLMAVAQYLYTGDRRIQSLSWVIAAVFLALAIAALALGQSPGSYYLTAQLLMPVLFAAIVATPAVRAFLAAQRGEAPPPELPPREIESLLTPGADGAAVVLREDAKQPAMMYSRILRFAATLLMLCGLGGIALGVLSLVSKGTGWTLLVVAILAIPPALALLVLADDWYYVSTTKGYEKTHLGNIVKNSQLLRNCVTTSLIIVALLAILEGVTR
jgi:hypothetical protein